MKYVAITSCATGIAHTYMAAEAITKACKKNGDKVKVEMQGALGVENRLSPSDIEGADVIIFANDIGIIDEERFDGYESKIKKLTPHSIIKNPQIIFD